MNQDKNIQVVMLATDKRSIIAISTQTGLNFNISKYVKIDNHVIPQHLYFLSDDEIKEGDKVYNQFSGIGTFIKNEEFNDGAVVIYDKDGFEVAEDFKNIKKIIASTDKSLGFHQEFIDPKDNRANSRWVTLPEPSKEWIEYFVSEYNKGNIITEVMVEYEQKYETVQEGLAGFPEDTIDWWVDKVKIKPDNTIIISSVEETWDDIINKFVNSTGDFMIFLDDRFEDWIKENYQVPKQLKS